MTKDTLPLEIKAQKFDELRCYAKSYLTVLRSSDLWLYVNWRKAFVDGVLERVLGEEE